MGNDNQNPIPVPSQGPDMSQIIQDPDFKGLSLPEKHKFLLQADPDYRSLVSSSPKEATSFLQQLHYGTAPQGAPPKEGVGGFIKRQAGNLISGIQENTTGFTKDIWNQAEDEATNEEMAGGGTGSHFIDKLISAPIALGKSVVNAQGEQLDKTRKSIRKFADKPNLGAQGQALTDIAGNVPVVGPFAESVANRAVYGRGGDAENRQEPDPMGALGALIPGLAAEEVPGLVKKGINKFKVDPVAQVAKAGEELKRVAPPGSRAKGDVLHYDDAMNRTLKYLPEEARKTPVTDMRGAYDAANAASKNIDGHVSDIISSYPMDTVDGQHILSAIHDAVYTGVRQGADVAKGTSWASDLTVNGRRINLDGDVSLQDADALRKYLNAEVAKHEQLPPAMRSLATRTDVEVAGMKAAADAARELIYDKLEGRKVPGVDELRRDQGSIMQMRDAFYRNITKADKVDNSPLPGGTRALAAAAGGGALGTAAAFTLPYIAGHYAGPMVGAGVGLALGGVADVLHARGRPNAAVERAFARLEKYGVTPKFPTVPAPGPIRGLLPPMGGSSNALGTHGSRGGGSSTIPLGADDRAPQGTPRFPYATPPNTDFFRGPQRGTNPSSWVHDFEQGSPIPVGQSSLDNPPGAIVRAGDRGTPPVTELDARPNYVPTSHPADLERTINLGQDSGTGSNGAAPAATFKPSTPPPPPTPAGAAAAPVSSYLTGKHEFSIFSAENPGGNAARPTLSPMENRARTVELVKELRTAGFSPQIVEGVEGGTGGNNSVFIPGMTTTDALKFQDFMSSKYGRETQSAIITKQGLVDVQNRTTTPIDFSRTQFGPEARTQPYHTIADHPFALHPTGDSIPVKEPFSGRHFSNDTVQGGVLSGARRGMSGVGDERARLTAGPGAPSGVYVYPDDVRPQPQIVIRKNESRVAGEKAIADVTSNPTWKVAYDSAKQEALGKGANATQATQIAINTAERALQSAGWDGYKNSLRPDNGVFLFGDQPVTKLGEDAQGKLPLTPELGPHPNLPQPIEPPPFEKTSGKKSSRNGAAPRSNQKAPSTNAATPTATTQPVPEKPAVKVSAGQEPAPATLNISETADAYNVERGLPKINTEKIPTDPRSSRVADAYKKSVHAPDNPAVKKSYDSLKADVDRQWEVATKKLGIKVDVTPENPYSGHEEMINDIRNNRHLSVWSGGAPPADHPLSAIDRKTGLTYNTKFRAVHDIFGHAAEANDFAPAGEENAWNLHRQMFSQDALPALATETKGQAAYTYKYGDFPPQKAAILPKQFHSPAIAGTDIGGHVEDFLNEKAAAAHKRIQGKIQGTLFSGLDPGMMSDMAIVGAAKMWKGARSLKAFSKEMLDTYGPKIQPYLKDIYKKAKNVLVNHIDDPGKSYLVKPRDIARLAEKGKAGANWYEADNYKKFAKDTFGEDEPIFTGFLAATSQGASVNANVSLALKAYEQWKTGEPFERLFLAKRNVERVALGMEPTGPKINEFFNTLSKRNDASREAVVDRWMTRAFRFGDVPTHVQTRFIQAAVKDLANDLGKSVRQVQSMIWTGVKQDFVEQGLASPADTADPFGKVLKEKLESRNPLFGMLMEPGETKFPFPKEGGIQPGAGTSERTPFGFKVRNNLAYTPTPKTYGLNQEQFSRFQQHSENTPTPGFVMPDGTGTSPEKTHNDLTDFIYNKDAKGHGNTVNRFLNETGAVRVIYPEFTGETMAGLEAHSRPTDIQIQKFAEAARDQASGARPDRVAWDFYTKDNKKPISGEGSIGELRRAMEKVYGQGPRTSPIPLTPPVKR